VGAKCRRAWDRNTSSKPLHDWSKKNERMNERNGCSFFVLRQLGGKRKTKKRNCQLSNCCDGIFFSFISFHFPLVWYYTSFHVPFPFPATSSEQYITRRTIHCMSTLLGMACTLHQGLSLSLSFSLDFLRLVTNSQQSVWIIRLAAGQ
jgi:hypothetical protein